MKLMFQGKEISIGGSGGGGGVPRGTIVLWSGTTEDIPAGWALCDGKNGTPDLRDRFVLGAGEAHPVGETGGEEEVTLTVEQMPRHNHTFAIYRNQNTTATSGTVQKIYQQSNNQLAGITTATSSTGSGQPHPNMPPYYTLCYIMRITE